jgi:hypothetical protein
MAGTAVPDGGAASKALVASRALHRAAMHDDDVMASS